MTNPEVSLIQTQTFHGDAKTSQERLWIFLEEALVQIGLELVAIDITNHREKRLRIFIDYPEGSSEKIGIEDCVRANTALDEPLEASTEIAEIFKGAYELEVSSPGIDRPLQRPKDFIRFTGRIARVHTFRALTAEETQALEYSTRNPKQKNFYGILRGFENESILLGIIPEDGNQKNLEGKPPSKAEVLIRIPQILVSKANLDLENLDLGKDHKK